MERGLHSVTFRFYADLNDFLQERQQGNSLTYEFNGHPAVKDAIEALGVPHPEVELILVNGVSAGFSKQLQDGERVSVYPRFHQISVDTLSKVKPEAPAIIRFVLDVHLGRLAERLRMLGFDVRYSNHADDAQLAGWSTREGRILLTRDRGLLKRAEVEHGYCVRGDNPDAQIVEVLNRYDLWDQFQPFKRCTVCNGLILPVERNAVIADLLPGTKEAYEHFFRCNRCGKVYWEGSHVADMRAWISSLEQLAAGAGRKVDC